MSVVREGELRAAVLLEVIHDDQLDDYRRRYDVTYTREGFAFHGYLYRFYGSRDALRTMVADCWNLRLSFGEGEPTLTDLDDDPTLSHPVCSACGEPYWIDTAEQHATVCPAADEPDQLAEAVEWLALDEPVGRGPLVAYDDGRPVYANDVRDEECGHGRCERFVSTSTSRYALRCLDCGETFWLDNVDEVELTDVEARVWAAWNDLDEDDPTPVKRIAARLGMSCADVAFVVYPAETFGAWRDEQEGELR